MKNEIKNDEDIKVSKEDNKVLLYLDDSSKTDIRILELQKVLNKLKIRDSLGKPIEEDGISGLSTVYAIKKLKNILGLNNIETFDEKTHNCINDILKMPVLKKGSTGVEIRYIQWRVNSTIDGIYGKRTSAAVLIYQKVNGLAVDGVVGLKTWEKLIL